MLSKMSNASKALVKLTFPQYNKLAESAIKELESDPSLQVARLEPNQAEDFGANRSDVCCLIAFEATDGPLSNMKMFIFMYFPWDAMDVYASFPKHPPVMWLMNKTGRYNADIYSSYIGSRKSNHSSMCLSILRPQSDKSSDWKAHYDNEAGQWAIPPMDTVFAAVQMMLTGYMVDQDYGGPVGEAVSMEKMKYARQSSMICRERYKHYFKDGIKNTSWRVVPKTINANELKFPEIKSVGKNNHAMVYSNDFNPQKPHVFGIDVSELRKFPNTVVTVRLGTYNNNMKSGNTRNGGGSIPVAGSGVTGQTLISNVGSKKSQWSYHGVPWSELKTVIFTTNMTNAGLELTVSAIDDQGVLFVSGLSAIKIIPKGNSLLEGMVHFGIYMNNKPSGGAQTVVIPQVSTDEKGYVQPTEYNSPSLFIDGKYVSGPRPVDSLVSAMEQLEIKDRFPVYASLNFTDEDTGRLHGRVVEILGSKASHFKKKVVPGHVTLMYLGGNPHEDRTKFFTEKIKPFMGKEFKAKLLKVFDDGKGMCATVSTDAPFHPTQKTHITMMLNKKPPVYSNQLISNPPKDATVIDVGPLDIFITGIVGGFYGK